VETVCLYEFVGLFHRRSFTDKDRHITNHPSTNTENVRPVSGRPPQERYTFMTEHPQSRSHSITKRPKLVSNVLKYNISGRKSKQMSISFINRTTSTESPSFRSSSAQSGNTITRQRRSIANFLLVWLDAEIDESNDNFRHSISQLRLIVNTINTCTDADQCIEFLIQIQDAAIFLIVSDALGQHLVPVIHHMSQFDSIYVFCEDTSWHEHEQWVEKWFKVKGVFTQIGLLGDSLKQSTRKCEQNNISVSFVSTNNDASSNQLDQSFMYTQILKEILFEIQHNTEQSIEDLVIYCREQFAHNKRELNNIGKFQREYHTESPIWWYTYECFLYPMLNRALRTQEIDTIINMGFFIQDLHRHIEQLYLEQSVDRESQPFTLYRGQGLSTVNFDKMVQTKGGLMSFNNFLSTSKKREVSLDFAHSALADHELVGILFKMTINPTIVSAPFALLDNVSYFDDSARITLLDAHDISHR
jgi:hypothetical protein